MARQFSLPYQIPPVALLKPGADAAGRTSAYRSLKNAHKAWIVCRVDQGNAATVQFSVLQAQDNSGTNSKAIANTPIWANQDIAAADGNTAQAAGASFTTSAAVKDKRVIFELTPEAIMDIANGFDYIAIQTGASNAANITFAELFVLERMPQASPGSHY